MELKFVGAQPPAASSRRGPLLAGKIGSRTPSTARTKAPPINPPLQKRRQKERPCIEPSKRALRRQWLTLKLLSQRQQLSDRHAEVLRQLACLERDKATGQEIGPLRRLHHALDKQLLRVQRQLNERHIANHSQEQLRAHFLKDLAQHKGQLHRWVRLVERL
jgi:hypothetical protein